jgi:hypothetical protein
MFPRRRFLLSSLALAAFESLPAKVLCAAAPVSMALPAWRPGVLEIHHIGTNRGNSALLILPDGTTMMVDAGANNSVSGMVMLRQPCLTGLRKGCP